MYACVDWASRLVVVVFHFLQGAIKLFGGNITYTDTFSNFSNQGNALLAMAMLNRVLATLPRKL